MWLTNELRALKPGRSDLRKFAFIVGGVLLALGALSWYRGGPAAPYLLAPGALLAILGAIAPRILRPLYFGWMTIGFVLGAIMTRIILFVLFLLVMIPIGLVMKLVGKDPLSRRLDPDAETYWLPKEHIIADRTRYTKYF